jgi:pyruvate/2-oxoglutarate dehydrogenase complex dihydrolipoamide acyltransferase (E2) component
VTEGEVIYTVETDKTTAEIEAQASGIIRPTGEEGATYQVGDLIGTIE